MAKPFQFEVMTPTETVYSGEVIHVRAPGADGEFGVLADHAPLVAAVKPGKLQIDSHDKSVDYFATSRGYFEVHENRAVLLVETCIRKKEIDIERATKARDRALHELENAVTVEQVNQARDALDTAVAQMKVASES